MDNTYVFIIWNKALWCQNKIVDDLKEHFEIINDFYINWLNQNIETNYLALYGRKLGPASDKIYASGKGKFRFLLVKDKNPKFETRQMFDGKETVNANIYDIKNKYRTWTAGGHRIHCSDTEKETLHDLVVLFGPSYQKKLKANKDITLNTVAVEGFNNTEDLTKSLELFGDNITKLDNNLLKIISKCRFDILSFINPSKQISNNKFELKLKDNTLINIELIGELDGDIPSKSFNLFKNKTLSPNIIFNNMDEYLNYLNSKEKMPSLIEKAFKDNNLSLEHVSNNPVRITKSFTFKQKFTLSTKLLIKRIFH